MKNKSVFEKIELIVYDFDGVFTDNRVLLREDGTENVFVNRADGLAINMIKEKGIEQIILTTETNKVVQARADKLGISAIRGIKNKRKALISYCKKKNISLKGVVYLGNDINDLQAMRSVGYAIAPFDAHPMIKKAAKIITKAKGGEGVVRELLDLIIEAGQKLNRWRLKDDKANKNR